MRRITKVTTVAKVFFALTGAGANPVIHPFPNESALEARIFVERVKVFFESAGPISHRMAELA
ncbi:hypothetical protein SDC9_120798 [bioreactor metagenome]|uniref:Uncharacterized protein n=1 Tax=bioreactor metagenome TaxID=1076179 RepID=A0A645CA58_9ZZZZ